MDLNDYKNLRLLKKYNHIQIYSATHSETQTKVTVYQIDKIRNLCDTIFKDFNKKLRIAKRLSHENFIHIYRSFQDLHSTYVVCEHFEGIQLNEWYLKNGPIDNLNDFKKLLFQLISVFTYLQKKQFYQCNLNPQIILIDDHLNLKINWVSVSDPSSEQDPKHVKKRIKEISVKTKLEKTNKQTIEKVKKRTNTKKQDEKEEELVVLETESTNPNLFCSGFAINKNKNSQNVNTKSDLWSLGFCLYCLVQENNKDFSQIYQDLIEGSNLGEFSFPSFVPNCLRNLFSKLLENNHKKRLKLDELKLFLNINKLQEQEQEQQQQRQEQEQEQDLKQNQKQPKNERLDSKTLIEMKKLGFDPELISEQMLNNQRNKITEIYKLLVKKQKETGKDINSQTNVKKTETKTNEFGNLTNQKENETFGEKEKHKLTQKNKICNQGLQIKNDGLLIKHQETDNNKDFPIPNNKNNTNHESKTTSEKLTSLCENNFSNKSINTQLDFNESKTITQSNSGSNSDNSILSILKFHSLGEESISSDCIQLLKDIQREKKKYSNLENEFDFDIEKNDDIFFDFGNDSKDSINNHKDSSGGDMPTNSNKKFLLINNNNANNQYQKEMEKERKRKKEKSTNIDNEIKNKSKCIEIKTEKLLPRDRKSKYKKKKHTKKVDYEEEKKIKLLKKIYQPYLNKVIKTNNNEETSYNQFSPLQLSRMRRKSQGKPNSSQNNHFKYSDFINNNNNIKNNNTDKNKNKNTSKAYSINKNTNNYTIKSRNKLMFNNSSHQINFQQSTNNIDFFGDHQKNSFLTIEKRNNHQLYSKTTNTNHFPLYHSMNYQPLFTYQYNEKHKKKYLGDPNNNEENEIINIVELLKSTVSRLPRTKIIQNYCKIFNDLGIKQKKIAKYTLRCQANFKSEIIHFELRVLKSKNEKGVNQIHLKRLNCNLWNFYAFWKFVNSYINFK
ncbi:serine/threonine-protein kinase nek [Anaeramoeba flamelloides]|uniref:Serine/threonine-protein kinase nek n=1 Tax=Anaeramoeba flamelloides TaxID=1746091 RepID=A0AAV7ZHP9_9EUKA|nr:serine/threonine-protein kinase nek [Anaeramoeba flamelloides]